MPKEVTLTPSLSPQGRGSFSSPLEGEVPFYPLPPLGGGLGWGVSPPSIRSQDIPSQQFALDL